MRTRLLLIVFIGSFSSDENVNYVTIQKPVILKVERNGTHLSTDMFNVPSTNLWWRRNKPRTDKYCERTIRRNSSNIRDLEEPLDRTVISMIILSNYNAFICRLFNRIELISRILIRNMDFFIMHMLYFSYTVGSR